MNQLNHISSLDRDRGSSQAGELGRNGRGDPLSELSVPSLVSPIRAQIQLIRRGEYGGPPLAALRSLRNSETFRRLPENTQLTILHHVTAEPFVGRLSPQLISLVDAPGFEELDAGESVLALEIYASAGERGKRYFRGLLKDPAFRLRTPDAQGVSLIENLYKMVAGEMHPQLAESDISKRRLLQYILEEIYDPRKINQDLHRTCAAATVQYMLCKEAPSEYVRLLTGLVSPSGQAVFANGELLKIVRDSIARDHSPQRSHSERIFQAALMQFAIPDCDYSNLMDHHNCPGKKRDEGAGMTLHETKRVLEALCNRKFSVHWVEKKPLSTRVALLNRLEQHLPASNYVAIRLPSNPHAVCVEQICSQYVSLRDPQAFGIYYGSAPRSGFWGRLGFHDHMVPHEIIDPEVGLVRFRKEDFLKVLIGAVLPRHSK